MTQQDPLWKLRHALAGVALAILVSVFLAAQAGSWMADLVGGDYPTRVAIYGGLMLYVLVGAGVVFAKVAQHETRPLSPGRVALWLVSLWFWPGLLLAGRRPPERS
jgi:4-amino-4-deoxy-L-arabinose transferase-like glycosyltransferase